jgi:prevent-host-death family protein
MARKQRRNPQAATALDRLETVEINAAAFKNTCLELMDDVRDHPRQYLITKHGRPVARLVPPDLPGESAFGYMRGTVLNSDDIVAPDPEAWGNFA